MGAPQPMEIYERLGVDYARVLHGEQHFRYHRLAFAGERLRFVSRIAQLYERQGGALEFIVRETRVLGTDELPVANLRSVMVVRHGRGTGKDIAKDVVQHSTSTPSSMKVAVRGTNNTEPSSFN